MLQAGFSQGSLVCQTALGQLHDAPSELGARAIVPDGELAGADVIAPSAVESPRQRLLDVLFGAVVGQCSLARIRWQA